MLYIRRLKYGDVIDGSSYFVKDGAEHADLSIFRVGDTVSISYRLTLEQYEAIDEMRHASPHVRAMRGVASNDYSTHLAFAVVKVEHFLASGFGVGSLRRLGHSIFIEPIDWLTEDVLMWVFGEQRPPWAGDE
jgi:hypothetical protein